MYLHFVNIDIAEFDHLLVCPLDWGLGHATRCIPLIKQFIAAGKKVSIAGNGSSLQLLKLEFPSLQFHELCAYKIDYPEKGRNFTIHMALQSPKVLLAIKREKEELKRILHKENIDMILSDNRYGCYSNKIHSVFMSHQLNVSFPKGLNWLNKINEKFIQNFDEVWVPDLPGTINLSGDLSHKTSMQNVKFIGLLSRFKLPVDVPQKQIDILGIVSGPEPQRSLFEELLLDKMETSNLKCSLVRGKPEKMSSAEHKNIKVYNHLYSKELQGLILRSETVICRSGYSSIMDLYALQKSAILIPTSGQSEQEYLGEFLNGKFGFKTLSQDSFKKFDLANEFSNIFAN